MDLGRQVAIVTGGGSGIGRAVAVALADLGVRVVICGRRTQPLRQTAAGIQAHGGMCVALRADVSKAADVEALVGETRRRFGRVDILVNNAGIGGGGPIHKHAIVDWDRILAVNLRGPFLMARAVLPGMRRRRRGHIVNISSELGLEHYETDGAYGVSKHALNALGEYIQRENRSLRDSREHDLPGHGRHRDDERRARPEAREVPDAGGDRRPGRLARHPPAEPEDRPAGSDPDDGESMDGVADRRAGPQDITSSRVQQVVEQVHRLLDRLGRGHVDPGVAQQFDGRPRRTAAQESQVAIDRRLPSSKMRRLKANAAESPVAY